MLQKIWNQKQQGLQTFKRWWPFFILTEIGALLCLALVTALFVALIYYGLFTGDILKASSFVLNLKSGGAVDYRFMTFVLLAMLVYTLVITLISVWKCGLQWQSLVSEQYTLNDDLVRYIPFVLLKWNYIYLQPFLYLLPLILLEYATAFGLIDFEWWVFLATVPFVVWSFILLVYRTITSVMVDMQYFKTPQKPLAENLQLGLEKTANNRWFWFWFLLLWGIAIDLVRYVFELGALFMPSFQIQDSIIVLGIPLPPEVLSSAIHEFLFAFLINLFIFAPVLMVILHQAFLLKSKKDV